MQSNRHEISREFGLQEEGKGQLTEFLAGTLFQQGNEEEQHISIDLRGNHVVIKVPKEWGKSPSDIGKLTSDWAQAVRRYADGDTSGVAEKEYVFTGDSAVALANLVIEKGVVVEEKT